jgi:hypothetical protein
MNRRATYLPLSLVALAFVLLIAGRYVAATPGFEAFRLLGFSLGGMLSVVTLVLCIYYVRTVRVRTVGLKLATAGAAIYGTAFVIAYVVLFTSPSMAARLSGYAF